MDGIISFFKDTLDGPLYIVTVILCVILLFACIGYLAERKIKDKKEKAKYATANNANQTASVQEVGVPNLSVSPSASASLENTTILQPQVIQAPAATNVTVPEVTPPVNLGAQQPVAPASEVESQQVMPPVQNTPVLPETQTLPPQNGTMQSQTPIVPEQENISMPVQEVVPQQIVNAQPTPSLPQNNSTIPQTVSEPVSQVPTSMGSNVPNAPLEQQPLPTNVVSAVSTPSSVGTVSQPSSAVIPTVSTPSAQPVSVVTPPIMQPSVPIAPTPVQTTSSPSQVVPSVAPVPQQVTSPVQNTVQQPTPVQVQPVVTVPTVDSVVKQ